MKKLLAILLAMLLCMGMSALADEFLDQPDESKTVESIEVHQMPDKTVYVIGEKFSAKGGVLRINYTDGTAALIDMTDKAVKLSNPTMKTANTKNVTAQYMKKRVVFKIEVAAGMCDVTFDMNCDDVENVVVQASKGSEVAQIAEPVREGYAFVAWYANPDFTMCYDFTAEVKENITVYALWKKVGVEHVNVTFDYDYYGVKLAKYSYPVEKDAQVAKPVADPVRVGYAFDKWVDENGNAFDFTKPLTADTLIKATWKKTVGETTWVFEAEDTDLTGKIGPSYSGSAQEESMIIFNDKISASGNRVVGYLYDKGITLEFPIACDTDVNGATMILRGTGEYITMNYNGDEFQILVNGEAKHYNTVTVEVAGQNDVPECRDLVEIQGVNLKAGANLIQLKTNNTKAISGTTFKSHAPMVDCISITTDAVLIWDENFGVPAVGNYQK